MPLPYLFAAASIRRVLLILGLIAAAVLATHASADNLAIEMSALANDVKAPLDGRNQTAVAVGEFTPLPGTVASAGPAIAKGLTEELTKRGVEVRLRADLTFEGRYCLAEDARYSK